MIFADLRKYFGLDFPLQFYFHHYPLPAHHIRSSFLTYITHWNALLSLSPTQSLCFLPKPRSRPPHESLGVWGRMWPRQARWFGTSNLSFLPEGPRDLRVWGRVKEHRGGWAPGDLTPGVDWAFIVILWNSSIHLEIPVWGRRGQRWSWRWDAWVGEGTRTLLELWITSDTCTVILKLQCT